MQVYTPPKVEVSDVCGAGDTFLAALTYGYLCTNSIENAIEFANRAASITVQHLGVYAPTLKDME
jgi:sugar/nucleoside kinase (ribokinase family)